MMPVIAIDYDGTFDKMPAVWVRFLLDARKAGCRIFLVSSRKCECQWDLRCENHSDILAELEHLDLQMSVILTSGSAKKWFMEQRGIKVDIWIDDDPRSIFENK